MRLFIALTPPIEAVEHLEDRIEQVRRRVPPPVARALRWVPPRRWHITLAFIGEVDHARVEPLVAAVASNLRAQPAPVLRLASGGTLGGHVVHVGVEEWRNGTAASDPLLPLASHAHAAVRRQQLPVDKRRFHPHLTVARFRTRIAVDSVTDGLFDYSGPDWIADDVELIESVLGPQPYYRTLAHIPLVTPTVDPPAAG